MYKYNKAIIQKLINAHRARDSLSNDSTYFYMYFQLICVLNALLCVKMCSSARFNYE